MYRPLVRVVLLLALLGEPSAVDAAKPAFFNAEIHALGTPAPDLGRAFATLQEREAGPAWVAYTVPMITGRRNLCCGAPSTCSLERSGSHFVSRRDDDGTGTLRVMLRIHNLRLTEVRAFSNDCRLDASGLPVYVWEDVKPRQSLDVLIEHAQTGSEEAEGALFAIAYHGLADVDPMLEQIARGKLVPGLAEEAVFWLGEARGAGGFEALERLRHELRDHDILEKIAFALHLSEAPEALPALIEMARAHSSGNVRGSALFWLSQEAGERATAAIVEASEEDPDFDVKERAIFAISQLPPDRGVPLLIRYAKTHDSREIRKKAMFWLGQTEDPRALDFFEEILTH